jgi:uncharacterized protein YqiB (DUF1249 family)
MAAIPHNSAEALVDSLIVPECVYRPGSFTGLMTIYESNYIKLRQLTADFDWTGPSMLSSSSHDRDVHAQLLRREADTTTLHAQLLRREAYTPTLRLTYWFEEQPGKWVPDPDLILRIYHDARLVEAVAGGDRHYHQKLRELANHSGAELDRRWRINMMLNKWLDYLGDVGHVLCTRVDLS